MLLRLLLWLTETRDWLPDEVGHPFDDPWWLW